MHLRLDWTDEELQQYDSQALSAPVVHESASPEAMKPTLVAIKV